MAYWGYEESLKTHSALRRCKAWRENLLHSHHIEGQVDRTGCKVIVQIRTSERFIICTKNAMTSNLRVFKI